MLIELYTIFPNLISSRYLVVLIKMCSDLCSCIMQVKLILLTHFVFNLIFFEMLVIKVSTKD